MNACAVICCSGVHFSTLFTCKHKKTVLYFNARLQKKMIPAKNTQYAIRNTVDSFFFDLKSISNTNYISGVRTKRFSAKRRLHCADFFLFKFIILKKLVNIFFM